MTNPFPASARGAALYATMLLVLFFALQHLYQGARHSPLERWLIDDITVAPSARLISWLIPEEHVVAQGHRLVSAQVRLSVLNGCEGTEVMLLLSAALLVFRMTWRRKLLGIVLGCLLVYVANQARIAALFCCLRFERSLFDAMHGYIAPTAVIAVAGLFFLYWVSRAEPRRVD